MPRGMSLAKLQAIGAVQSKAEKPLAQPSLQAVSVRWDHRKQTRVLLDKKGTSWKDLYLSHVFLSCLRYLCIQQWTDCIPCTNADQLLKSCMWLWAVPVPLQGIYQPNDRNKVQESCYLYSLSEKKVLAAWWCLQTAIFSLKKKKKSTRNSPTEKSSAAKGRSRGTAEVVTFQSTSMWISQKKRPPWGMGSSCPNKDGIPQLRKPLTSFSNVLDGHSTFLEELRHSLPMQASLTA